MESQGGGGGGGGRRGCTGWRNEKVGVNRVGITRRLNSQGRMGERRLYCLDKSVSQGLLSGGGSGQEVSGKPLNSKRAGVG